MHAAQHSPGVRLWSEVDGDELGWTHVPVSRRHCHGVMGGMPLSLSDARAATAAARWSNRASM